MKKEKRLCRNLEKRLRKREKSCKILKKDYVELVVKIF